MGRYISGDIEGKCWFGVQSSAFADRFGVPYSEPGYITYYYTKEDLPAVQEELEKIRQTLGDKLPKMEEAYNVRGGLGELDITDEELSDFADYCFGLRLEAYLKEHNDCTFDVEV